MRSFAAIILAAGITAECNAWWGTGHLIVARRAFDILSEENPAALAAANVELQSLARYYSDLTYDEGDYPFVECADFADNIKGKGYSCEGGSLDDFTFVEDTHFVTDAITGLTAWLKNDGDYTDNYYYETINDKFSHDADGRSFALRLIIHYVGDIHQPLHATAEINSQFPSGDRGGNSQWIPNKDGAGNLHAVWDSVIYQFTGYPNLPFNSDRWTTIGDNTSTLNDEVTVPRSDYHDSDAYAWADESLQSAKDFVYPGYEFNTVLDDAYVAKATVEVNKRLMYGGRRLANLISSIYGDNSADMTQ